MKSYTEIIENVISGPARRSNWPDLPKAKPRRALDFIAIDVDGETIATAKTMKIAQSLLKELKRHYSKVKLRHVYMDETDMQKEDARRREVLRFEKSA